jgi:hypothetical protein
LQFACYYSEIFLSDIKSQQGKENSKTVFQLSNVGHSGQLTQIYGWPGHSGKAGNYQWPIELSLPKHGTFMDNHNETFMQICSSRYKLANTNMSTQRTY